MRYSRSRITLVVAVASVCALFMTGGAAVAAPEILDVPRFSAPVLGAEEGLGQAFPSASSAVTAPESVHGVDADGNAIVFWMTNGNASVPAMLQVTEVVQQKVIFSQRVHAGRTASAVVFSPVDGTVYISMTTGEFYSWKPGDAAVTTIGTLLPGESVASLTVAPDGLLYGGTAPSGLVFSLDPATGAIENLGHLNDKATSVNSLSADGDYVYVGSEPGAQLSRYDRQSGDVLSIALPESVGPQASAQDQSLVDGHLFVRLLPSSSAVVYDTSDLSVEDVILKISGRPISGADPTGKFVYFRHTPAVGSTAIFKYNLDTHTSASFGWAPNVFPRSFSFVEFPDQTRYPGVSVVLSSTNGRIYSWSEEGRAGTYLGETSLQSIPKPIQAISAGVNDAIYVGGDATAPGLARIGSDDATFEQLTGLAQVDSLASVGDRLIIGSSGGLLRSFDTTAAWAAGSNPAEAAVIGNGQERPIAMIPVGDEVAVGSVATGLGGAISLWDPASGEIDVYRDLIADQGVVALVERDGILYGGTTVRGGSGTATAAAAAEVFSFDPATGEVGFHAVPVPEATSVNGLAFDADGVLWGIAGQELFSFDVEAGAVIAHDRLFATSPAGFGDERALVIREDGLYASVDGRLLRIDPETWDAVMLADAGVENLREGSDGHLYYSRHGELFRWNFTLPAVIEPVIPSTSASVSPTGTGWRSEPVTVTLSSDTARTSIEYALNGGAWQAYSEPVVVTAEGEYTLSYRSRALQGHLERPRSLAFAIDAVAPTTGVRQADDVVVLIASDGASGVAVTEYRIDAGEWSIYDGPLRFDVADAGKTLEFRSTDAAGNIEEIRTHVIGTAGDTVDRFTNHGDQVQKVQVLASMTILGPDDAPLGVYVVSGNPNLTAEFSVIDLRSGEPVLQTRLPHGTSSQRAIAQSPVDGAVYFGTSDVGHIYRYMPGADDVEYLAAVPRGELVWSMAVGEDGTVWFGTYSSGKLYSLDPATAKITDHGQAVGGEQYIDSIAPLGDTIYVGTQSNARLAAFDRTTGTFTELAMPDGHHETALTELEIRGHLMFASSGSNIYVRDLDTGEWVDTIEGANARVSPIDPHNADLVYARIDNQIQSYSLSTGEITPKGLRPNAAPESWSWLPVHSDDPLLVMTYWNGGRTYGFSMTGGQGLYLSPPLLGAAAPLISLGHDTSGNVYSGAFLSPPGMGQFNPSTGATALLSGTSQVEGYGIFNGKLVFGRYPQGSLYLYDPSRPWAYGTNPQEQLELGDEQSRPHGFVQIDKDTVVVASVPKPGTHGGALTLWQPEEGTFTLHRNVVENQTPASIVLHEGVIIGGTSIEGGYGIDPVTSEANLFAWDPESGETLWTVAAVPGAKTLSGLAVADDGMIWGIADGRRIFEFDPETRTVLRTITVDETVPIDRYGDNDRLLFDHGRLFASIANRLLVVDTVTEQLVVLVGKESGRNDGIDHVMELTQDTAGDLYVIVEHTQLASFDLSDDVTAPEVRITATEGTADGMSLTIQATDAADALPLVQTRIDGGAWQAHPITAEVVVPFGATLEYRAIDAAWNASALAVYEAAEWSASSATVTAGSAKARAGAELEVTGVGFVPWSTVSIRLKKTDTELTVVETDETGAFEVTVTIPERSKPGRNDLVTTGVGDAYASTKLVIQPAK